MAARIFVVEDDEDLLQLLEAYLLRQGYEVELFSDGKEALRAALNDPPDLVILDLMLPGLDGLALATRLREERAHVPIIMLTARTTEQDRLAGLRAGADDYVVKPFSPAEVVLRVQAVLRRAGDAGAVTALSSGPVRLDPRRHLVTVDGQAIDLTPTEFRLLEALMLRPGWTFSRQQLLDHAIGTEFMGFDRNIDVHIANLRKKLRLRPSPIRTVYGVGYRLEPSPETP
jgi:two-component system alkaline phosphatase synthesis response regulator PhoP